MPRLARAVALLCALACALACAAAASEAALSPDAAPAFVPPEGYDSLLQYCRRGLSALSDAELEALYASAAPRPPAEPIAGASSRTSRTRGGDAVASSATARVAPQLAASAAQRRPLSVNASGIAVADAAASATMPTMRYPRGCVDGCILLGHGSALLAPTLQGVMWSGKCFHPGGHLQNFGWANAPRLSGSMEGTYVAGPSLGPASAGGGEPALVIRYPGGTLQDLGAMVATAGYLGTGADSLEDFLDEVREVPGVPGAFVCVCLCRERACVQLLTVAVHLAISIASGLWLGITYVAGVESLPGAPHVGLWFALAQTESGLEEYALDAVPEGLFS